MAAAGVALLGTSVSKVIEEDRVAVDYRPVLDGGNARVQWRDSQLVLELEYDGGFEVEVATAPSELSSRQQALVASEDPGADRVFAEVVYEVGGRYYEAYYFKRDRVLKKIAFDGEGNLLGEDD
jgi:hypothetical protein